jgi:two-component system, LytTR family, sensor kinase
VSSRALTAIRLLIFANVFGSLQFTYRYLDTVARGYYESPWIKVIEEFTGAYTCALTIPVIVWATRRFPIDPRRWIRSVPVHLLILACVGPASTTLMWGLRSLIFPLAGFGAYDYGRMPERYFMEFPLQVLWYAITVAVTTLYDRQTRAADLEKTLAQAQLQNLRLQPHFLFNTLNTISAVMYEDARVADKMIARLSDLLRMSLEQGGAQEVPLEREIEFLNLYVETMKARFEDRLKVVVETDESARGAMVPPLVLQPLVENSIRHGADPVSSVVDVRVCARRVNGDLMLEVRDQGPGLRNGDVRPGIGLTNTAERLKRLYGGSDCMEIRNGSTRGVVVTLKVPFHVDSRAAG